jgi:hypothetical protein
MLSRLRDRLTYANVVATMALFVALGGTSYAAITVTSKNIKNRTIKGGDIAKDTIGGTEIRESKLGTVPKALAADSATAADVSKTSGHATSAGSADTAASATLAASAQNAQQLAGQAAGAFEKSTRTQFGKAAAAPANTAAETAVLTWPELGVQLTSAAAANAPGGCALAVGVKNTKSTGSALAAFERGRGSIGSVAAAGKDYFCSTTGPDNVGLQFTDATGRALFVDCIVANAELRCLGTRSEP